MSTQSSLINGHTPFTPRRTDLPGDPLMLQEFLQSRGFHSIFPATIDLRGDPRGPCVSITQLHHLCREGQSTDVSSVSPHGVIERSDGRIRVDPTAVYALPGYDGTTIGFGDLIDPESLKPLPTCFRTRLRELGELAASQHGLSLLSGLETEAFMHPTGGNLQAPYVVGLGPKDYYQRLPHQWPDFDVVQQILGGLAAANLSVTVAHSEVSPRQIEVNTAAADPVRAAQDFMVLMIGLPRLAAKLGYQIVFTAKPVDGFNGSGEHTHLSARKMGTKKENALFNADRSFTEIGGQFMAGLFAAAPALTFLGNLGPSDYRRLVVVGYESPTSNATGWANRTCSLRLTGNVHDNFHVEFRAPSPSGVHAFALLIGMVGAGLWGIEQKLEAPTLVTVNAYKNPEANGVGKLPQSFAEAQAEFAKSEAMKFAFNEPQLEALVSFQPHS